eukprot:868852-Pyramimonas_sp.AAC.1
MHVVPANGTAGGDPYGATCECVPTLARSPMSFPPLGPMGGVFFGGGTTPLMGAPEWFGQNMRTQPFGLSVELHMGPRRV